MRIHGIDFTSRPTRRKPITCLECRLDGRVLSAGTLERLTSFGAFEDFLKRPGTWIAGIDFPFGQPRKLIENLGWPKSWTGYSEHVGRMTRQEFRKTLDDYRANRAWGDKEHRRATDISAGSLSPMKLYGTPVGLMFYEGAPRLRSAGVTIPGVVEGDQDRIVVEAYPGVLARNLIGRRSYKQDTKAKQTEEQRQARKDLLNALRSATVGATHGLTVEAPDSLIDDPGADELDALICAIQAAWSWTKRTSGYGMPPTTDTLEGWIAEPSLTKQTPPPPQRAL